MKAAVERTSGPSFEFASLRTTTSHTIGLAHMRALFRDVPQGASPSDYAAAVVEDNVLGAESVAGRERTLRYLRELHLLDSSRPEFVALRWLWTKTSSRTNSSRGCRFRGE